MTDEALVGPAGLKHEAGLADNAVEQTNFSQLYLTIWDHIGHTVCPLSSEELEKIYEAHRRTAEDKEAMTVD